MSTIPPSLFPHIGLSKPHLIKTAWARFNLKYAVELSTYTNPLTYMQVPTSHFRFDPAVGAHILYNGTVIFVPISNIAAVEYFDRWE